MVTMAINVSFTKFLRRLGAGVLATGVTTFIAVYPRAGAEIQPQDCSLRDVGAWQAQLVDREQELSPGYILRVTEAFLARCPTRPEVREASKVAGIAATNAGEPARALRHFERAGQLYDERANFYKAAVLLANGEAQRAWALRDQLVADWLEELAGDPLVAVESHAIRGGFMHTVRFARPDHDSGIGTAWIGVPDGPGWPATLTMGAGRQRTAFHRLRAGAQSAPMQHVDYYRCRGRRLLAETEASIAMSELDEAARLTLIGYFTAPDGTTRQTGEGTLKTCLWPSRILPRSIN